MKARLDTAIRVSRNFEGNLKEGSLMMYGTVGISLEDGKVDRR